MEELTEADLYEGLTVKERKEIPLEDFAWPEERKYPVDTQDHLDSLATLIGRAPADMQPKIKARAKAIAKRRGFTLPQSWQDEEKGQKQETSESQRPAKKIGTLPICWLEYGARSLNGRIYPKATCDAIYEAACKKLADPNALPPTTFVSHEAANGNVNTQLVGGPTKVWKEGSKFWANIDLADTTVAHDMLGLAEGKYLRSGSMRVLGVELRHDRNYDLPLVMVQEGADVEFLGIDLTTRPGLDKVARIPQVLYESDGREPYVESFDYEILSIESKEVPHMGTPIYLQVALGMLTEAKSSREAHTAIHDHIAGVMDEAMGKACHGSESARYKALIEGQLDEAGKAIAMKHAKRLAKAHDESARQLGMKCEGVYNDIVGNADNNMDGDSDGDNPAAGNDPDNDGESRQEEKPLTEQEMIEALKAKGFAVEAPKTDKEEIADLKRMLAEQNAKIAQLTESQTPPARQTMTESQFDEQTHLQPEKLYSEGDYLKGDLNPKNWRALANKQVPWPQDLDPALVIHELAPFMNYSLLNMQEASAGRSLHEQVKLGLYD